MSEFQNQIINSLANLPHGIDHPIAAAGSLVAAGTVLLAERAVFRRTNDTWAAPFPNAALLEQSVTPDLKKNDRERMAPAWAMTAGIGFLALQVLGSPTYESTTVDSTANVIIVKDASLSMRNTKDIGSLGMTRAGAVDIGLQKASASYAGNLGIVQSGANVRVTLPLGKAKDRLVQAEKPKVDPNGGQIISAINLAVSLLPTAKNGQHEGSLVVISDGTVDDKATEVAATAVALKKEGVTVKVIVPGTAQGKYELGANRQQIQSGASPEVFAGFGAKNVIEAKDAKGIDQAIQETLVDAGTSHEDRPWYVPGIIGALLLGGGIARDKWQRATRKI